MSSLERFDSFAIVGAGKVGGAIIRAFAALDPAPRVVVFTRKPSDKSYPAGIKIAVVDYDDTEAVAKTLQEHGVQVVISTVGHSPPSLLVQKKLADASKQAGVQLFSPSAYDFAWGDDTGLGALKNEVTSTYLALSDAYFSLNVTAAHLRSIQLPSVTFYVCILAGQTCNPLMHVLFVDWPVHRVHPMVVCYR
jgi:threonine dehydrogenase-like Zn-dependent dehydrogenase